MPDKRAVLNEASRLQQAFVGMGAQVVETDILQPADLLLDLYGEDIRARAYVTDDPVRGEAILRPDFTVPVTQMHMSGEGGAARYTYSGTVFRKQQDLVERPSEYLQTGFEIFDASDAASADAEVFAGFASILSQYDLRAVTGDIGLLMAAVGGLATSERRRAALLRHIWRPRKFRKLLDRFAGLAPLPKGRAQMIAQDFAPASAPEIGKRSMAEVEARLDILREEAQVSAISTDEFELLIDLLSLREKSPDALARLRDLTVDMPALAGAVERFEARLEALDAAGTDVSNLDFEASFGRTSMEYYDGFVFGFLASKRPEFPPIATGGRYDAMTRALGNGRVVPAVGGVIRPAFLLELEGGYGA